MVTNPIRPSARPSATRSDSTKRRLSRPKRLLFILASVTLPILVLLALEGVLRWAGFGGYLPTVREVGTSGGRTLVITDTTGATTYFDTAITGPGSVNQFSFFDPKPPDTIRIVLTGGSAIKGFPQPMGFAPSAFLTEMLTDLWPDRNVEVINLGTTAVASFPALDMLGEMLEYQPDLVVVYSGHNEFFGAYGVASMHRAATWPVFMKLQRAFGSTAWGQFLATFRRSVPTTSKKALMEGVVGQAYIGPDSPLRQAAARNLYTHVSEMIQRCRSRAIPVIVCTLASNERGMAPIGTCDLSALGADQRSHLTMLLRRGSNTMTVDAGQAVDDFREALRIDPDHAQLHYLLGQALEANGQGSLAAEHFQRAIDLDPMPWRAPRLSMDALRRAADDGEAVLCDVQQTFRDASPSGAVGWELMDDHVHPTLKGQWLIAKSILDTLTTFEGELNVLRPALDSLPGFDTYARRLGDNFYDRYGVVESMYRLFDISFMKASNPDAFRRIAGRRETLLATMSSLEREQVRKWADPTTHSGFKLPLSGMVAPIKMRQGLLSEAESLFGAARRHVPDYTGPYFEYTCFGLACRQQTAGGLSEMDRQLAQDTIERIELFLQLAEASSGQPERFMGRLYQILEEHDAAIPHLLAARAKLTGDNQTKATLALLVSYVKTGQVGAARAILEDGIRRGGPAAQVFDRFLSTLPPDR